MGASRHEPLLTPADDRPDPADSGRRLGDGLGFTSYAAKQPGKVKTPSLVSSAKSDRATAAGRFASAKSPLGCTMHQDHCVKLNGLGNFSESWSMSSVIVASILEEWAMLCDARR